MSDLDWLKVGEEVAHIAGSAFVEHLSTATVEKIGKRDVVVKVNGRTEKFNINHRDFGHRSWLRRSEASGWGRGANLAPLTDPYVLKLQAEQRRRRVIDQVSARFDDFRKGPDVATALELRDAVDAFLKLEAPEE